MLHQFNKNFRFSRTNIFFKSLLKIMLRIKSTETGIQIEKTKTWAQLFKASLA